MGSFRQIKLLFDFSYLFQSNKNKPAPDEENVLMMVRHIMVDITRAEPLVDQNVAAD